MSAFALSQILIAIAILFDLASFQFKDRRKIVGCLCFSGVLISSHFVLLAQWTAAGLMAIATIRYFLSAFTTSKNIMYGFILSAILVTFFTFSGAVSLLGLAGTIFQTTASFNGNDKKLRQLMMIGTSLWLLHNYLVGSPMAVLMEVVFISSNLVGYYRFYIRCDKRYI